MRHSVLVALALALAAGCTAVLLACDADPTVAISGYFVVVVVTALFGTPAAITGMVASYLAFNFWFIPPRGSLPLNSVDDVASLIAFVFAAAACSVVVTRLNSMRRKAEAHERAAYDAELAAAINENRAAFLSSMTHNLRTPLASIRAAADTLRSPSARMDDPTRARLVATVHDEADRLERLVGKVLELSRVHAGVLEPEPEATDVAELTREAVRRLRHVAPHHSIDLAVEGDLLVVDTDPAMLELVLVNLLENALRYGPTGTDIGVFARAVGTGCEIRVVDHGPGIAPADRERVFEEFVRLDGPGSGLGLAIARAVTECQQGSLTYETTPGGGATFVVALPGDANVPQPV
ncbi:MAG TPA: ATP-binding protein [Acidimicrobiia bacterium]|jgi:K+-sensing histidine kinase KdpD